MIPAESSFIPGVLEPTKVSVNKIAPVWNFFHLRKMKPFMGTYHVLDERVWNIIYF